MVDNGPGSGIARTETGEIDERALEMYRLWAVFRKSQASIAKQFGVSQQRVSLIIAAVREIKAKELADRQAMQLKSFDTLEEITQRAMALAEKIREGAPVAVGKDGNILYDADGSMVRDYSGYLAALKAVKDFDAETAKRFGLSAPDRVETTGTVRYEIVDVSSEDLT